MPREMTPKVTFFGNTGGPDEVTSWSEVAYQCPLMFQLGSSGGWAREPGRQGHGFQPWLCHRQAGSWDEVLSPQSPWWGRTRMHITVTLGAQQSVPHSPCSRDMTPNHGAISAPVHPEYSSDDIIRGASVTSFFSKVTEIEISDLGNLAWITIHLCYILGPPTLQISIIFLGDRLRCFCLSTFWEVRLPSEFKGNLQASATFHILLWFGWCI